MSVLSPQLDRALDFALLTNGGGVAAWMTWAGWQMHVGCDRCAGDARAALCWGRAGCHGYEAGCGCSVCAQQQLLAEAQFAVSTAALDRTGVITSLRAELAGVVTQIESSNDRSAG